MIDCIFTLDYEIYGNGTGSLNDLVYAPTVKLRRVFEKWNARFVAFVEVAELQQIDKHRTDPALDLVKQQVRDLYDNEYEIALHLHPQWFNARHENSRWFLDLSEYNLCVLRPERIAQVVDQSLNYLRTLVGCQDFTPISFRAGNWLFQPTANVARILADNGLKLDSSVFKGGLQHNHTLDYRRALRNGSFWSFDSDVTEPVANGAWLEIPIHTEMVPFWQMPTSKRLSLGNTLGATSQSVLRKANRLRDFMRWKYPLKLDFTRMTLDEMTSMMSRVIREDQTDSKPYRPVVAIGHTKDLADIEAVDAFLSFLRARGIGVVTLEDAYKKIKQGGHMSHASGTARQLAVAN